MTTSYVQYNSDFSEVEAKYPSLTLWVDGENKVFFEEDGERTYVKDGEYIVLKGNKHVIETDKPEDEKPAKTEKTTTTTSGPVDDTKDKK